MVNGRRFHNLKITIPAYGHLAGDWPALGKCCDIVDSLWQYGRTHRTGLGYTPETPGYYSRLVVGFHHLTSAMMIYTAPDERLLILAGTDSYLKGDMQHGGWQYPQQADGGLVNRHVFNSAGRLQQIVAAEETLSPGIRWRMFGHSLGGAVVEAWSYLFGHLRGGRKSEIVTVGSPKWNTSRFSPRNYPDYLTRYVNAFDPIPNLPGGVDDAPNLYLSPSWGESGIGNAGRWVHNSEAIVLTPWGKPERMCYSPLSKPVTPADMLKWAIGRSNIYGAAHAATSYAASFTSLMGVTKWQQELKFSFAPLYSTQ